MNIIVISGIKWKVVQKMNRKIIKKSFGEESIILGWKTGLILEEER